MELFIWEKALEDCSIRDLLVKLFSGELDEENDEYSSQIFSTQSDIAEAIAKATHGKCTPQQPGITKQLSKLLDKTISIRDQTFAIHRGEGGYMRIGSGEAWEIACAELLREFSEQDIFSPTFSSIAVPMEYRFCLNKRSEAEAVTKRLSVIFDECIFSIDTQDRDDGDEVIITVRLCPLITGSKEASEKFMKMMKEYYGVH